MPGTTARGVDSYIVVVEPTSLVSRHPKPGRGLMLGARASFAHCASGDVGNGTVYLLELASLETPCGLEKSVWIVPMTD